MKFKLTVEYEYTPNPKDYETEDPLEMLEIDRANIIEFGVGHFLVLAEEPNDDTLTWTLHKVDD